MADSDKQRYYWLKLPLNFFDTDKIKLLRGYPNGAEYIIFYQRLLLMAANRDGYLRLDDEIPYDSETLAILTDTNVDIVKGSIEALEKLRLIEILDDRTIFMSQIEKLIGSETNAAIRKRIYRQNQREIIEKWDNVPLLSSKCPRDIDIDKEKEIDKEIDIDKEKDISTVVDISKEKPVKQKKRFVKPTYDELNSYIVEKGLNVDAAKFIDYYESNGWKVGKNHMQDWKATARNWDRKSSEDKRNTSFMDL